MPSFLVEVQTNAILVPRARHFLVTGSLQIKPNGSVDENERMLGTYMRRMRNNNLEITIASILVPRATRPLVSQPRDQETTGSGDENGLRAPLDARNDCFVSPETFKLCENYQ